MKPALLYRLAIAVGLAFFVSSCAEVETATSSAVHAVSNVLSPQPSGWWEPDRGSGSAKIVVHLGEQKAYFYRGGHVIGETTVSTGKPGFATPPGHYHVVSKDRAHVSSEFGDYVDDSGNVVRSNIDARKDKRPPGTHFDGARMPYCMHFNGGYAMHEGYVPPYAASHGCIRIPRGMAEKFFEAASEGTPILVKE